MQKQSPTGQRSPAQVHETTQGIGHTMVRQCPSLLSSKLCIPIVRATGTGHCSPAIPKPGVEMAQAFDQGWFLHLSMKEGGVAWASERSIKTTRSRLLERLSSNAGQCDDTPHSEFTCSMFCFAAKVRFVGMLIVHLTSIFARLREDLTP